ncbi:MAG: GTPase ObgE [Thermodesulfobacteriota bacterium]
MKFIDEAKISVASGKGGAGAVSFRREKFVPRGGPNGGDGGEGASVIFVSNLNPSSLLDFRYKRSYQAESGGDGGGKDCHGKNGEDLLLKVPVGTIIKDAGSGEVLHDFTEDGEQFVCVKGGRGGKGNAFFKSSTHQTPRHAQPGEEGSARGLIMELKLLADVGIIGFPNAGKSTFIARVSAAKPKVADYPFTTLTPNLGVVKFGEYGSFVLADIPGLIEGAHSGKGLGTRFLKHIERTSFFMHMLDLSPETGREPTEDFEIINKELKAFNPELAERPQIVVLNKIDLTEAREKLPELLKFFEVQGIKVFTLSAVTGEGMDDIIKYVGHEVERIKDERLKKKDN